MERYIGLEPLQTSGDELGWFVRFVAVAHSAKIATAPSGITGTGDFSEDVGEGFEVCKLSIGSGNHEKPPCFGAVNK